MFMRKPFPFSIAVKCHRRADKAATCSKKAPSYYVQIIRIQKPRAIPLRDTRPWRMRMRVCAKRVFAFPSFSATRPWNAHSSAFVTARNSELCTLPDNGCYLRLRAQTFIDERALEATSGSAWRNLKMRIRFDIVRGR